MKRTLIIFGSLVVFGAIAYGLIPRGEDALLARLDRAKVGKAKQPVVVEGSADHTALDLSADNTKIGFSCAKQIAGKTVTVRGGWSGRFDSTLNGRILVDEQNKKILRVEVRINVPSLWSEHDQLTEALLTKGFFQVSQHPVATFVSTAIREGVPESSAAEDATHVIEGNFTLNGIAQSISFPVKIQFAESGLKLTSRFSLSRKDFHVNFSDTAGFGLLSDENISPLVALTVSVDAAPGSTADQHTRVAKTDGPDNEARPVENVDISKLSKTFTETIPATQVEFEMVLVPDDAQQNIPPLYFGKHEVTWDEFMPWADSRDIEEESDRGELRALKLRPSPPYGAVDHNFGMDQRPALGMSRLCAERYCEWLSEQTGKKYRLPTEEQWQHAYVLGGGNAEEPPSADDAKRLAVFVDNSFDSMIGDFATRPVGSTEPNALGIFDMVGNVCEWVIETGDQRVARGGHFDGERELLGVGRHIEDPDEWNRDYPNEPKSIWWFVNARWVGFRVVCNATSP